jgi:DNA-binding response OmpR family regulator
MFITGFSAVAVDANLDSTEIISKPFHLKELIERIDKFLQKDIQELQGVVEQKTHEIEKPQNNQDTQKPVSESNDTTE